jgi:hypothetical protein
MMWVLIRLRNHTHNRMQTLQISVFTYCSIYNLLYKWSSKYMLHL